MKDTTNLFNMLAEIAERPKPYEFYTAEELWNDEYTSEQMLMYHLNPDVDLSSRNHNFIEKSANWITDRFKLGAGKKVIDFGCGPGLYTSRFAKTGANVTGIDFSNRSIEYAKVTAKQLGLNISFLNMNYLDFESYEKFDLITMIMCDFCALSPYQRDAMISKFNKLLSPGGKVLLDVYSLNAFEACEENTTFGMNLLNGFWSASDYFGFVCKFKYLDEKVVLDKHTIIEPDRIRVIYNWLQHFSPEMLAAEFAKHGFSIENIYANVAGDNFNESASEFAIVAVKN